MIPLLVLLLPALASCSSCCPAGCSNNITATATDVTITVGYYLRWLSDGTQMSNQVDWCVHCEVSDLTSVDLYILNIEFVPEHVYLVYDSYINTTKFL